MLTVNQDLDAVTARRWDHRVAKRYHHRRGVFLTWGKIGSTNPKPDSCLHDSLAIRRLHKNLNSVL